MGEQSLIGDYGALRTMQDEDLDSGSFYYLCGLHSWDRFSHSALRHDC